MVWFSPGRAFRFCAQCRRSADAWKCAKPQNRHRTPHRVTVWLVAQDAEPVAMISGIIGTSAANRSAADLSRTVQTMTNLSRFLIIDKVSGTVLCADQCYLVDDDSLSTQQWDAMESMSDAEIGDLAINHGRKLSDVVTLPPILPGESG